MLSIPQQIKVLKEARLFMRAVQTPTKEYDEAKPVGYDTHVEVQEIYVNTIIGFLLGEIEYLSKEILLMSTEKSINKELWRRLKGIRTMIRSQNNTTRNSRR